MRTLFASPATLLINGSDTVTRLNLLGTLAGSGTLTAQQYALDGGTVKIGRASCRERVLASV